MNLEEKVIDTARAICLAPDSDEVSVILRKNIDELVDENIMGIELRSFLQRLREKLNERKIKAKDYIEINNIRYAADIAGQLEEILMEGGAEDKVNRNS